MTHTKKQISALNYPPPSLGEILGKWLGLGGSWLKPLLMTLLFLLEILITVCVTYKVIVSCLSCCVSPTPTKIMMSKQLETIDHIYSSL